MTDNAFFRKQYAAPRSSVGSVADLGTGVDTSLSQYSFRGLMLVIATGFIPLSRVFDNGYVGKQTVAWKEYCAEYWLKELQESMDRCTGRRDITEILLKKALNTIQYNRRQSCSIQTGGK